MKTHKFARKPFYVDAVRVSEANITEVAEWAESTVEVTEDGQRHVKVKVHRPLNERQCQAFIGDWVLFAGTGFKVYTPKAFDKSFEKVKTLTKAQADEAGIKVPHEPRAKIGAVGLAFKDAEAKKAPVPAPPKQKRQVSEGFNMDRIKEAIADSDPEPVKQTLTEVPFVHTSDGETVEIAPGVTGVFESQPSEIITGQQETVIEAGAEAKYAPSTTPQFSEIAVTQPVVELSEEEKQANADAAIAEVLSDSV